MFFLQINYILTSAEVNFSSLKELFLVMFYLELYYFPHPIMENQLNFSFYLNSTGALPDVASSGNMGPQDIPTLDPLLIETKNKKAAMKLEKLDNDLKNYKSNSIKESIRRGKIQDT
jgi:26S proteasome subunit RPN7.